MGCCWLFFRPASTKKSLSRWQSSGAHSPTSSEVPPTTRWKCSELRKTKNASWSHGGVKSLWEPAGGHGEQVPDAEGVRSSGQPPLPPSGHARAPLLLRPDAPGHGSQIRGALPAFGRKVPSRGAYVGVRTGRNGQWGAALICVNKPREISSPWGKVAAGHIFRFLRLWGTQRPGHAGGRHWPHVGKRRTPDAGRRPASPVAGRRP